MINYQIKEVLASTQYSDVYMIEYDNKNYAMKKINLLLIPLKQKKYLLSELNILSEHKCKYLVKYYNTFVQDDHICIIMEYCSKGTLESVIKQSNTSVENIWKYTAQICSGLKYLHTNNIIHRDLKCSNIMIDSQNNIQIIDFGVSKILNNYMKYTKSFVGTPYNMSPEIIKNVFYDYKIDIWALGIIIYQMTHNNKLPFMAKSIDKLNEKITLAKFNINHQVLPIFQTMIKKCIQVSPHRRIKLDVILRMQNIKKHLDKDINVNKQKTIKQINKVPQHQVEWNSIVNNLEVRPYTPITQTNQAQRKTSIYSFMEHYSKDNLVRLNTKLIDVICEKNNLILKLEQKLK